MKVSTIIFGALLAAVAVFVQHSAASPVELRRPDGLREIVLVEPAQEQRQKRSLLLGAGAVGLLGAGAIGAGVLGAGLIGAKAGFLGGALAGGALSQGRSYGGYYGGYGGGYGGYSSGYGGYSSYGGYGGYSGYGSGYGGYRSYYPSSYVVDSWY